MISFTKYCLFYQKGIEIEKGMANPRGKRHRILPRKHISVGNGYLEVRQCISVSFNFESVLNQTSKPWKSLNMRVRVPSKRFQKQTPIECCVRPPMPQVMKVCFILVLGHRCETCTPLFNRGERLKITPVLFALLPRHSLEKMMQRKTCAPPFYRGCLEGGTCTPRIYNYKIRGPVQTWIHRGMK